MLVPLTALGALGSGASPGCGQSVRTDGPWTTIQAPEFPPTQPQSLTSFAVVPSEPSRILATNGYTVRRTTDGGCTWHTVWPAPVAVEGLAGEMVNPRVAAIAVPDSPGTDRIHLVLRTADLAVLGQVLVMSTDDGGGHWRLPVVPPPPVSDVSAGTSRCGYPASCRLVVAPSAPDVLYLAISPGVGPGSLYVSRDAGSTFRLQYSTLGSGPLGLDSLGGVYEPTVSPDTPDRLWASFAWSPLSRSDDGGSSWLGVAAPAGAGTFVAGMSVGDGPGGAETIFAAIRGGTPGGALSSLIRSDDGGRSWSRVEAPAGAFRSTALSRDGERAVVTLATGTAIVYDRNLHQLGVLRHPEGLLLYDAVALRDVDAGLALLSPDAISLVRGKDPPVTPIGVPRVPDVTRCLTGESLSAPDGAAAHLTAKPARLALPPGRVGTLDALLDLPPRATPVDVYFLLDTSGSMQSAITSLAASVVQAAVELAATGIDLHVGLGEFRDVDTVPYRRLVQLAPLDCQLPRALDAITTGGGQETHLLALRESVSGEGWNSAGVQSGGQANFRPGALGIVVHATDEPINDSVTPGITRAAVARVFLKHDVHHVGLLVLDRNTDVSGRLNPTTLRNDLDGLARSTHTLTPRGGIDCDGDGIVDLREGQPVTCVFDAVTTLPIVRPAQVGDIVARVVRGLRSTTGLSLVVENADGLELTIADPGRRADLRQANQIPFVVSARCPTSQDGRTAHPTLAAVLAGSVVARANIEVACEASLANVPPPVIPAAALALVPPLGPPAPVTNPAQAPSASEAQATNPAFGAAVAPENQWQVARAEQRTDEGDAGGDVARGIGAAMTAAAAVLARRRATRGAPAYARRDR